MNNSYLLRLIAFLVLAAVFCLLPAPPPNARAAGSPNLVMDINPLQGSGPLALTNVKGTLFFQADDGVHGLELWKSDGTKKGTVMVKDINPSGRSNPRPLVNINGTLFFRANDGVHGVELWAYEP